MKKYDIIIIGAGLAGLTTAYKLATHKKKVLLIEKEKFLGGRTSSWKDQGMLIESGFHRHIGFYKELPKLLKEVGISIHDILVWEKEIEIKLSNTDSIILGIAPFHAPIKFIRGMTGNRNYLTLYDKYSLSKLFAVGFKDYMLHPKRLDNDSILEYAMKKNISKNVIDHIITPLSTGIFFQPKENYSSKLFFGIFYPSLAKITNIRIGAYLGGMSDVLAKPIAKKIIEYNGNILKNTKVKSLLYDGKRVTGVKLGNGNEIIASQVVLATDIGNAKKIIKNSSSHPFFKQFLEIDTTSAITVQIDLKGPTMKIDRATFAPHTILASFTEESHTTFPNAKGRLSIILANPDAYLNKNDDEIMKIVLTDAKKIGLDIEENMLDYRIIRHKNKFYHLGPNHDYERPTQQTPIPGLILAGDYTRQKFYATMEGAVISGLNAYQIAMKKS